MTLINGVPDTRSARRVIIRKNLRRPTMNERKKNIITASVITVTLAAALTAGFLLDRNRKQELKVYTNHYVFGTMEIATTYAPGTYLKDSYYYADEWFLGSAEEQNDELALASMQLAAAAVEAEDSRGIKFLKDVGFEETGLVGFDAYDPEGFNYTWGRKTIGEGEDKYQLVAVAIQSYSFDSRVKGEGWQQNFTVNGPEAAAEHYGFAKAVDKMAGDIRALASDGKAKFWITGHSRAGALANILAARLGDGLEDPEDQVYAYTFEAPATVDGSAVPDNGTKYAYIHNYFCDDDIVTMVPPWGMTTYGVRHLMNTESSKAKFPELIRLSGSPAAELFEVEGTFDAGEKSGQIVKVMSDRISTRSDYTREYKDEFTDSNGSKVTMTYVYQDIFVKLMDDIFGGKNSNINTEELAKRMNDLAGVMKHLATAQQEGSDAEYLEAVRLLSDLMKAGNINTSLNEGEVFGLIKLAAPILVPLDEIASIEDTENKELVPFVVFAAQIKNLVISHQFESSVAYLKEMARGPEFAAYDQQTGVPAAGAGVKGTEDAIVNATVLQDAKGRSFISGTAKFLTDDTEFAANKVYYLEYKVTSIGHAVPEDFTLTVGKTSPIKPAEISYADGCYTISGVFRFTVGTPQEVTVTYDMQGHGQPQEPMKVPEGTILRYECEMPDPGVVSEGGSALNFKGWEDPDGRTWEDITVVSDTTLKAVWLKVIDTVNISYRLPEKDEPVDVTMFSVPEGAPYKVTSAGIMNQEWSDVDKITEDGEYILKVVVTPDDDATVLSETDESGEKEYIISYVTNGQAREVDYSTFDCYYTDEDRYFNINIHIVAAPDGVTEGTLPEEEDA